MNRYERPEDAATRLDASILFYKGAPAYLRTVANELRVFRVSHPDELICRDTVESPDLDLTSPELGYINFLSSRSTYCKYFSRAPYRRYKQGLCRDNTLITNVGVFAWTRPDSSELFSAAFEAMLMDKYPVWGHKKIQELVKQEDYSSGNPSIALSKKIAVSFGSKSHTLFLENRHAADMKKGETAFTLRPEFANSLVHHALEEKGIPCNEPF